MQLVFICCLPLLAAVFAQEEALSRCKRPLCDKVCMHGFQTDKNGCISSECQCLQDPCQMIMCDKALCQPQPCSSHPCTKIEAKCIGMPPCPVPMCANRCEFGYKKSPQGCDTCQCNAPPIDHRHMPKLCHLKRQLVKAVASEANPENHEIAFEGMDCEEDGTFRPLQCYGGDCWCVDDRGMELSGSRVRSNQRECVPHVTKKVVINMVMKHTFVELKEHDNSLKGAISSHMSHWLEIDEKYIEVTTITPTMAVHSLEVEVVIRHDGVTDLAYVAKRFQMATIAQKHEVQCHGGVLTVQPESIRVTHTVQPVTEPEVENHLWHEHHKVVIVAAVGLSIFLCTVLVGCAVSCCRKCSRARSQFDFKKLGHMSENLAFQNESLGHPDMKNEDNLVKTLSVSSHEDVKVQIPDKY